MIRLVKRPSEEYTCGQCCVAMAADVSLDRAKEAVGSMKGATCAKDIIKAFEILGVPCGTKRKRMNKARPVLPKRCMVWIMSPKGRKAHWMLYWDGEMYDPDQCWPDGYQNWTITSYLPILA